MREYTVRLHLFIIMCSGLKKKRRDRLWGTLYILHLKLIVAFY